MTKYITIRLTEDQAVNLLHALLLAKYSDEGLTGQQKAFNAFCYRTIQKINKSLAKAKISYAADN